MTNSLVQALSTEKQVTSIPLLLETVVAFLSSRQQQPTDGSRSSSSSSSALLLVKPLGKLFQKACYGAPVRLWGRTLLPLLALMPGQEQQVLLLQAVWEGRHLTLSSVSLLATAVAECASFVLLLRRQQQPPPSDVSVARDMAQLWLLTLALYLSSPETKNRSDVLLKQQLAKDLVQFQEASYNRPNCAFYRLGDWFWDEGGLDTSQTDPAALAALVRAMMSESSHEAQRLVPHLRGRFLSLLGDCQSNSGAVPSKEVYDLLLTVLEYCGPRNVFLEEEGSLEKFVMNDVLRWIILHTSELSTTASSEWLVKQDFAILYSCLAERPENRARLWNSLLNEIVLAQCDLHWLVAGLGTLVERNSKEDDLSWISCDALKSFAIRVAAMERTAEEDASRVFSNDLYMKELNFFRLCLGLTSEVSVALVGRDVLTEWIDRACDRGEANDPVLDVLLETIGREKVDMKDHERQRVALKAWATGTPLYAKHVPEFLVKRPQARESFLSTALTLLQGELQELLALAETQIDRAIEQWSSRAFRFLGACAGSNAESKFASPSLRLLGLLSGPSWESHATIFYHCAMALLLSIDAPVERLSLFLNSGDGATDVVQMLTAVADGIPITGLHERSASRTGRCENLLSAIGGKGLQFELLEAAIKRTVANLRNHETLPVSVATLVFVLSKLIETAFLPVSWSRSHDLRPEDIREGSRLWYITDSKQPSELEVATVSQVHYDAQAGYYFSIRLRRGTEEQERQTVLERLRKDNSEPSEVPDNRIEPGDRIRRTGLRGFLMDEVVRPFFRSDSMSESGALCGEVAGVLAGVIGFGEERGVGTAHYEAFQLLVATDSALCNALTAEEFETAVNLLWAESLGLGYGLNSGRRRLSPRLVRINIVKSCNGVLDLYATDTPKSLPQPLNCAVLAWITSALEHLMVGSPDQGNTVTAKQVYRMAALLFRLATKVLSENDAGVLHFDSVIACRAVSDGTRLLSQYAGRVDCVQCEESALEASNAHSNALFALVKIFAIANEASRSEVAPREALSDIDIISRAHQDIRDKLFAACRSTNAGRIAEALFSPARRCLALRLLMHVSEKGTPLQPGDSDVVLGATTEIHLSTWLEGLEEEEASQLEEDVYIVAEWVPLPILSEIESWKQEMDYEAIDDSRSVGQLLTWIAFLRFVDAAAPADFRIRPAFLSYLGKCEATNHILNLALLNEKTIDDGDRSASPPVLLMEDLLAINDGDFKAEEAASVALFRTVEVLPSLARRWWEEECPKVYTAAVQTFLEKQVAPKILQRELERIKNGASDDNVFGEMAVTASAVSREITAQYIQDDFCLKVLITLPAAFPFRSAEVDCSKTLGVSQNRWKRWSLQIRLMLNSQGGTLQDALLLWKDNVDREFEGVEPCPVCYSVLHVKTHKLPSLECKTCQNRFHVQCLTQWFRSSGKSQCVLCQQPWQGTRVL